MTGLRHCLAIVYAKAQLDLGTGPAHHFHLAKEEAIDHNIPPHLHTPSAHLDPHT